MRNNWADYIPVPLRETESSYVVYEPLIVEPYTIHIWSVSAPILNNHNLNQNNQKHITSTTSTTAGSPTATTTTTSTVTPGRYLDSLMYSPIRSYLPDHTVPGLVLPQFAFHTKSKSISSTGGPPVYIRSRTISTPANLSKSPVSEYNFLVQQQSTLSLSDIPSTKGVYIINEEKLGSLWQLNLYKDGGYIEPFLDNSLKEFNWAKNYQGSWINKMWTKVELCDIICDIFALFNKPMGKEEVNRWLLRAEHQQQQDILNNKS